MTGSAGRRARWVTFTASGLYPVELVYYQNETSGYLEWSRASTEYFGGDDVAVDNVQWATQASAFAPVPTIALYGAAVGSNTAGCAECGVPGMDCASGSYCGDGLCQACVVANHCGPSCQVCPASARICSSARCVECKGDADCADGATCDSPAGRCVGLSDSAPLFEKLTGGCNCEAAGGASGRGTAFDWLLLWVAALTLAVLRLRRRVQA